MSKLKIGIFVLAALVVVNSCGSPTDTTSQDFSDPAVVEAAIRASYLTGVGGVIDFVERLLIVLNGGPADGVVVTPNSNGLDALISVDFTGDGSRESTITAALVGDVSTGAVLSLTSIDVPQVPSLVVFGGATVMETSPGMILVDGMSGSGSADPPGSENAYDVVLTGGSMSLDLVTGNPSGGYTATIQGEGEPLSLNVTYEPDGSGGFRIRFSGPGFDFTIP